MLRQVPSVNLFVHISPAQFTGVQLSINFHDPIGTLAKLSVNRLPLCAAQPSPLSTHCPFVHLNRAQRHPPSLYVQLFLT